MINPAGRSIFVAAFVAVAIISGCSPKSDAPGDPVSSPDPVVSPSASISAPVASQKDATALDGQWRFKELAGQKITLPSDTKLLHIQFRADAKNVSGFAGCNTFSGSYETDGAALKLGPLISTRMACGPDRDKIESTIHAALGKVVRFTIQESDLSLIDADGGILITAEAIEQLDAVAEDPANI